MRDEFILECLRSDAEWLSQKSLIAKNGDEYGSYVDTFVAFIMTHLGYSRKKERTTQEIVERKEVWRKEEEDGAL